MLLEAMDLYRTLDVKSYPMTPPCELFQTNNKLSSNSG